MFVDETVIKLIAGKGGDGCTSFRREKFVPMGGPDGGNGGKGASIIFEGDESLKTLVDLKYKKQIKGEKGVNGKGSCRNGKNAEDIIIKVPLGTTIYNQETNALIADITKNKQSIVVAPGGRGGRGNKAFATHNEPAPKFSELGEPGEEVLIKCELKVMADVGLIGLPSVGKSTILSMVSSAKPKIASYHFTTLNPNLGVVKINDKSYTIADLPGLIEGASNGAGLGHKFLKHALRTKVLAHVIDMGSEEGRDPIEDYEIIRKEIENYSDKLKNKKEIIIANKMDLENAESNLKKFQEKYKNKEIYPLSAINNDGFDKILPRLLEMLEETDDLEEETDYADYMVYKYENTSPFTITKEDNTWVVKGKEIEKLFNMTRFTEDEAVERFARKLKGMGVEEELLKLGAKYGDEIEIEGYSFEFKE